MLHRLYMLHKSHKENFTDVPGKNVGNIMEVEHDNSNWHNADYHF